MTARKPGRPPGDDRHQPTAPPSGLEAEGPETVSPETAGDVAAPLENQEAEEPPRERTVVNITDPLAIRALAHRVRLDVIDELFGSHRSHTATELAKRFGLTPSAMSYHLRALEKWGYVVRAESTSDGRERHWKAAGDTLDVGDLATASDLVTSTLVDVTLGSVRDQLVKALQSAADLAEDDKPALLVSRNKLWLTEDEAKALAAEYEKMVDKYRLLRGTSGKPSAPGIARRQRHLTAIFVPDTEADPEIS